MKRMVYVFAFVFIAFIFCGVSVSAKVSDSEVFEIEVGKEDTLNVYYTLEEDGEKVVKERINFAVTLKGLSETKNDYRWEHTFCYVINDGEEICEYDLTGSDQENPQYIYSNQTYNFTFYDTDMPYYSEDLFFNYVVFKNKFVCLDCESDSEIILEDIRFEKEDIDYKYNYEVNVSYVENDSRKYVTNYSSNGKVFVKATFINNSGSNLSLTGSPTYNIVNEVCVAEDNCHEEVISEVYSSDDTKKEHPLSITPYLGSLSYYYYGDNLLYGENNIIPYEFAKYKTSLICLSNCDSRRVVQELVVSEENYYFDYTKPNVDEENTIINSHVEGDIIYSKNSEVKITLNDDQSGLNIDSLKYFIVTPYYNSCSWGSSKSYSFVNGEIFVIGNDLTGGYCMYYQASDKNGNTYESDYYIFYFDNKGPEMSFENTYDSSKHYNEVIISPAFVDNHSKIKGTYYLWSKEIVDKDNYMFIKNYGSVFSGSITCSELRDDGSYYLYIVSFDNLDNYSFYDLGVFNIDRKGLELEEVIVDVDNLGNNYSNTGEITLTIEQIEEGEEFKCGFFSGDNVSVSDLTGSCYNKRAFSIPSGYEGEYNLFVYVRDRANNYSLFKVLDKLKIDTKAPNIDYSILYDDDKYRIVNEITLNVSDLVGVNEASLKYGWFAKNKVNVVSSNLVNSFSNGETLEYPRGCYGEYKLYVLAIDNVGNEKLLSLDKIFKIDTDFIRISLVGEKSITILKGEDYKDLGAVAYKGEVISGGRASEVIVDGSVDSSKEGVYYITYTSGEGDLLVSVTREVIVKNNFNYIIGSITFFVVGAVAIVLRLFIRKKEVS